MKRTFLLFAIVLTLLWVAGCDQEPPAPKAKALATTAAPSETAGTSGKVIETITTAGYTYVQVDTGREKVWAAAPEFPVKVGDQVEIPEGAPMRDYHSNSLNRDFALVYFVGSIRNNTGGTPANGIEMPTGHPPMATATPAQVDVSGVAKAEGGMTVGELFAGKAKLSGKEVTLRGKVVKSNPQIMGKNWMHVRDGSGDANAHTNDLTVTTDVFAKVGDTVLVRGKVALNKDFGYGYKYDVIIEGAKVTVEPERRQGPGKPSK